MHGIDMLEGALRDMDRRVMELEQQRDRLKEALKSLQSDCKQGAWITPERWLQVSAALEEVGN